MLPPSVTRRTEEYEKRIGELEDALVKIHQQATRHHRATDEREYLIRDLQFIGDLAQIGYR